MEEVILQDVRSVEMSTDLGQHPWVECKVFHGFYKPTDAKTKRWPVAQIRLVSESEFQELVDKQYTSDMAGQKTADKSAEKSVEEVEE